MTREAPRWFRMQRSITDSLKVSKLSPDLFRTWVYMLACTDEDGVLADIEAVAYRLRGLVPDVAGSIEALIAAGMFDRQKGRIIAHNWDVHNPKSSTQRMRKLRAKNRVTSQGDAGVTRCGDADVTFRDRDRDRDRTETDGQEWVPSDDDADAVIDRWNVMAASTGLQTVKPTTGRRKLIVTLLSRLDGPQVVINALALVPKTPFLLGKGKRGWKASLDFLMDPNNFEKLREGGYEEYKK